MKEGVLCTVCPRGCVIREGQLGYCGARINRNGKIVAENYGKITAIALDPIEKKPLQFPVSLLPNLWDFHGEKSGQVHRGHAPAIG